MSIRTFMILCIFLSCIQGKRNIIDSQKVRVVKIYSSHEASDTLVLDERGKIDMIIDEINRSRSEPIKFYSATSILIIYNDKTELLILSSGTAIKANGKTYRIRKSINDIVQTIKTSS